MATAVEVQVAANPRKTHTAILNGAPKSEALSTWWREVRQLRLQSRRVPDSRPRPAKPTVGPRDIDSSVSGVTSPSVSATVSATPSHESSRAAPPVQSPTRPAAAVETGLLDVEVRLSIQEKLQTLVLASALGLKADRMADFTEQEEEALRRFQTAYDENRAIWFRGKRMPSVIFELVALRSSGTGSSAGGRPQTSICVRGLHSEDDIRKFHAVMSRSAIRRLYSGLRLSYDKTLIQRLAKEVNEDYHIVDSLGKTLCGTRLVTQRPGQSGWSSTIGGIILVEGVLYAMTSSHMPDDDQVASTTASPVGSSPSTIIGAQYDDDVESALILDPPCLSESASGAKKSAGTGDPAQTPSYFWPTLTDPGPTLEHDGGDWRLIRLSTHECLPNSVPPVPEHAGAASRRYLTDYLDGKPLRSKVTILAGFSGLCRGTLLSSPAFLSVRGAAPAEVWTVVLDGSTTLQEGDSGSWVVDDQGRWVGTVTALSGRDAYLFPAHVQLQQMRSSLERSVSLPSPLRCYLNLAADHSFTGIKRYIFATKALTPEALIASASDMGRVALTLAIAKKKVPGDALELLLISMGTQLYTALTSYPWVSHPSSSHGLYESFALSQLLEIHHSIVVEGRTGSRAEIQMAIDGDLVSPEPLHVGTSSDAGPRWMPASGLPLASTLNQETPSHTPNPTAVHPPDDEGKFRFFVLLLAVPSPLPTLRSYIPIWMNQHIPNYSVAPDKRSISRAWVLARMFVECIVASGASALAGIAALAALLSAQPSLRSALPAAKSFSLPALGATAGLCLAAPLVFLNAVHTLLSLLTLPRPRWFKVLGSWFYLLALFPVGFARALIAVAVVSTVLSIDLSGQ
jgi:hypothetical protein